MLRHNSRRVGAIDLIDTRILRVYDTRDGLAETGIEEFPQGLKPDFACL